MLITKKDQFREDQFFEINLSEAEAGAIVDSASPNYIRKINEIKVVRTSRTNNCYNLKLGDLLLARFNIDERKSKFSASNIAEPSDSITNQR